MTFVMVSSPVTPVLRGARGDTRGTSRRIDSCARAAASSSREPARHASKRQTSASRATSRDSACTTPAPTVRRGVETRASSSAGAGSVEPPRPGFTEPYSFFNLATAEFPDDWGNARAKVRYEDSPLDVALMAWFSRKIAAAIDVPPPRNVSYDEFIALCFLQMRGRDFAGQRDITFDIMTSLMPPGGDAVFRKLFPVNAFSLELNAAITKIVFAWMVGPMEVRATTDNDLNELLESQVHIKKCRWLQESGCTAMCANMCKTATQDFFGDVFGLPLTIAPNFEDKSCDFYFGKTPPPIEADEALTFGCNALCKTAQDVDAPGVPCHKLRPYEGETKTRA
jgi:hypothetical protein